MSGEKQKNQPWILPPVTMISDALSRPLGMAMQQRSQSTQGRAGGGWALALFVLGVGIRKTHQALLPEGPSSQ